MTKTIKSALASFALGAFLLTSAGTAQAAEPILWNQVDMIKTSGDLTYYPLRSVLEQTGVTVKWVGNETRTKLVLEAGGQSHQLIVQADNQTLTSGDQTFGYQNINGSLMVPLHFFMDVLDQASVSTNRTTGALAITPVNQDGKVGLRHLEAYVAEPKPQAPAAPAETYTYYQSGQATWYGAALHGHYTASGEPFNMYDLTAAHKTLPFGTRVKVTNLNNGLSVVVRITDRGPFAPGRVIDLSMAAAQQLNMISSGVAAVNLEIVG